MHVRAAGTAGRRVGGQSSSVSPRRRRSSAPVPPYEQFPQDRSGFSSPAVSVGSIPADLSSESTRGACSRYFDALLITLIVAAYLCATLLSVIPVVPFWSLLMVVPVMYGIGYAVQRGLLNHVSVQAAERPAVRDARPVKLRDFYRLRGSSASRSPSPSRLKARTRTKMARPGQIAIHGAWSM